MAKQVPWDDLLEIIDRFPEGASLEEIMLGLNPSIPRRTLQRWLAKLVQNRALIAVGSARSRRYKLPDLPKAKAKVSREKSPFPLTKNSAFIEQKVTQPLHSRPHCTYHREFLQSYKPNITSYLSPKLREKLGAMGTTIDGAYPAGTYARQIFHRLLIDLTWNSSRLEGNTYSLLETERLLEWGTTAEGKDLKDMQMILNHKRAIEFLIASAEQVGVNRFTILNLHTLLSDNLLSDPAASGRLRTIPVGITHSTYLPTAIPAVISECFDLLITKASLIEDPFEQAFFLMVHIPYLQAFDDVNKRTSRLAANIPLIKNNLCPLSFIDVPEQSYINGLLGIYELNRVELLRDVFEWGYERSCARFKTTRQTLGEPDPFRIRYRQEIKQVVVEIVLQCMNKPQAAAALRQKAYALIPSQDQARFIETIERELLSLHEGNIARYALRPSEFERWKETW
jgi:Fic family protein